MASTGVTPSDIMVTIKVNYNGQTKRFKLPLRDMGASTLEDKIRSYLSLSPTHPAKFERYSDSAGSYIVLDRANVSVYKQLYRAAKAKSKLKIRVTDMTSAVEEEKQVPQPVTVEDEPEVSAAQTLPKVEEKNTEPVPEATAEVSSEPQEAKLEVGSQTAPSTSGYDFDKALADLVRRQEGLKLDVNNHLNRLSKTFPPKPACPVEVVAPASPLCFMDYRVCCNNCEKNIPDVHYHCTRCDDDDFDLCSACVESGVTCYGEDHWLIKRFKKNGVFVSSSTETIPPKPKVPKMEEKKQETQVPIPPAAPIVTPATLVAPSTTTSYPPITTGALNTRSLYTLRTCNCCVRELPEILFLHCNTCEDYDLCTACFRKDTHGHHPKHGFAPAVEGTSMPKYIEVKLGPGRNTLHNAICDGCERYIKGVRHKCLDCPDWDYCGNCVGNAKIVHPGHRFAPIYETLQDTRGLSKGVQAVHVGICCDGPLCASRTRQTYIAGVRYKCAVCHDTDFCANCEASPSNTHNKTHPLIMFKTPVRHVTVSTSGEHGDGKQMPVMGDRHARPVTSSRVTETTISRQVSMNNVQTVVNVEPTEAASTDKTMKESGEEIMKQDNEESPAPEKKDLHAVYIRDTVTDGSILPPNHVFEQTWVLRNTGSTAWPAGCSVKFVGGDYMGHVDSSHPAKISELVSSSESTVCHGPIQPGDEFPFTVLLRTPSREGKIISYWRLTCPDGNKFGHRLWCDVNVQIPTSKVDVAATPAAPRSEEETHEASQPEAVSSQMIFPKLEKESPVSSIHEAEVLANSERDVIEETRSEEVEDFDDCGDEWDGSDDEFLTDEEYDILDASDEEYLEAQEKLQRK